MKTIVHAFALAQSRPTHRPALLFKEKNQWSSWTWQEYYDATQSVAWSLKALGVNKKDRVAIIAGTRREWAVLDFAIMGIGGITVPIYQNTREEDVLFILNNSEAKILFVEDRRQEEKWLRIAQKAPSVLKVVLMDGTPSQESSLTWNQFLKESDSIVTKDNFSESCRNIERADTATMIYTSGTSGQPKAVILSHEQIMSEVEDVVEAIDINPMDTSLSFLPYSHVLGRVELWLNTYVGFSMAFAESIERIRVNLKEVRPTVMIGVPRIFEKIYTGILSQVQSHSVGQKLFQFSRTLHKIPGGRFFADRLIYSNIREQLGGRLRFAVCGGAPLSKEIAEFFYEIGILLLEGYGLTETTAAVAVNTPTHFEFGTVGRPLGDVEIRFAEDGEILIRSKKVMRGYYKDPEANEKAFIDGFFATGDIGEFSKEGFLKITDRKKDLIKTSGGKFVAPQKIESLLKLHPLISNVLVHGDQKKYIVVLLTLNSMEAYKQLDPSEVNRKDLEDWSKNQAIHAQVRKILSQVNQQLASHESIKNFAILPKDFTVESGELTPSLKVRRKFCDEKYQDVINRLYD